MPEIDILPLGDLPLNVLCEDGPVLAVNKPAGLLTQGVPTGKIPTLEQAVRDYIRVRYNKPGNVYLGIPHRLDRPVSGAIVFARNSKAAARLAEQFRLRQVRKIYWAVCSSLPKNTGGELPAGELTDWLLKDAAAAHVTVVSPETPNAREAKLRYKVVQQSAGRCLIEVELLTGRMHQIRVQLAHAGAPVLGDTQYGGENWGGVRAAGLAPETADVQAEDAQPATGVAAPSVIALHAVELTLLHPVRYDSLTIRAPVPESWREFGFATEIPSDGLKQQPTAPAE